MLKILLSLVVAIFFGIAAQGYLGSEALINHPWVDTVFWAIIGSGLFLAMVDIVRSWLCPFLANCPPSKVAPSGR